MATFIAIFFALFIFTLTTAGIITAVGSVNTEQYDIAAAANLVKTIYVKSFGVPEIAAGPISFLLLAIPAVLSFYIIQTMFTRKR
ncbi:MAG: hypothetical protein GY927_09855 [bacterium]|nr:hypothetical protein [bacterium]